MVSERFHPTNRDVAFGLVGRRSDRENGKRARSQTTAEDLARHWDARAGLGAGEKFVCRLDRERMATSRGFALPRNRRRRPQRRRMGDASRAGAAVFISAAIERVTEPIAKLCRKLGTRE